MTIGSLIKKRGINELMHFTTNLGVVGIFRKECILSRERLPKEATLEFIFSPNSKYRKDIDQLDYVNLSISKINSSFFQISSGNWHRDKYPVLFWCILSIDPSIAEHDGVLFSTTNNIYPSTIRGSGLTYFEKLFDETVFGRYNKKIMRPKILEDRYTTCEQAEVLYPRWVPANFIRAIYVSSADDAYDIVGALAGLPAGPRPTVHVRPELFAV